MQLLKNSTKSMPIDLFKRVVEKVKTEGYDVIGIYNWTEPFLATTLPDYISIVKESGLSCWISSNLSLKPLKYVYTIEQCLRAGIDRLIVSVSGYSQVIYEINHVGGNMSWVKGNLVHISQLKRKGIINSEIFLRLIKFDYNKQEEPLLKEYANSLGLDFEVIDGVGHPDIPVTSYASEDDFLSRLKNFNPSRIYEKNGDICSLIIDTVSIDSGGNVYICCAQPNYLSLRIGPYLEIPKDDLLLKRYTHPICISCAFPRRKVTECDRKVLLDAMKSRLGNPNELAVDDIADKLRRLFHKVRQRVVGQMHSK
jgi:hypothetical protein